MQEELEVCLKNSCAEITKSGRTQGQKRCSSTLLAALEMDRALWVMNLASMEIKIGISFETPIRIHVTEYLCKGHKNICAKNVPCSV